GFMRKYEIVALDQYGEKISNVTFDTKEVEAQVKIDFVSDQKVVGVQPNVVGVPAETVWIKSINVDPSFVVLDGDPEDMSWIEFVDTGEINVDGITESKTFNVEIVGLPDGVVVGGTSQISVFVEVEQYAENNVVEETVLPRRTLQVPVVITKFNASQNNKTVDPPAVTLVLEGSDEVLRDINLNNLKIDLDISEFGENSARIDIDPSTFNLPSDVKIVTITPSKVTAKWD
ncbi:hypothetical protein KKC45_00410, partial [Patescibacteria group bacterium]|nr:hypothetical protein [Patescibacteria group bacterium]